jgi:hypothetical protein
MLDPDPGQMIRNTDVEIRDNREKWGEGGGGPPTYSDKRRLHSRPLCDGCRVAGVCAQWPRSEYLR